MRVQCRLDHRLPFMRLYRLLPRCRQQESRKGSKPGSIEWWSRAWEPKIIKRVKVKVQEAKL